MRRLYYIYRIGLVLSLTTCLTGIVVGQNTDDRLTVFAGVTFFNNPELDTVVLVEFPFTLNRHEFDFFRPDTTDSRYFTRIFAQLDMYGIDGLPVDSTNTYFSVAVPSLAIASEEGYKLFNNLALLVKPGVYSARLTVIDVVSKRQGQAFYEKIIVEPSRKDKLSIGGKCLAYNIAYIGESAGAPESRTVKNGFDVLCNPLGIFGIEDTAIFLYAELYNLEISDDTSSSFRLSYSVADDSDRVFRNFGFHDRKKSGTSAVIVESFDITGWPAGIYRLQIAATDLSGGQTDTAYVPFRILVPDFYVMADFNAELTDPLDTLSAEVQLSLVYYLLNPVERQALKDLNETGRKSFVEQYWRDYDSDPTTSLIENRLEMHERYIFCNMFYSTNDEKINGWQTDRGRIHMLYGPWEERDDIQTPRFGNPFEVWYYRSIREGAVFVFEDKHGQHDYTLVHSNVEGEIHSDYWKRRLDEELYKIY